MTKGVPWPFDPAVAAVICVQLSLGRSLRAVLKDDGMPSRDTVFRWIRANEAFLRDYNQAREDQADTLADEILDIADEEVATINDQGFERVDSAAVQRQRLRVDARKWVASKLKPKKYGEKVSTEISGPDGGPVVVRATQADAKL